MTDLNLPAETFAPTAEQQTIYDYATDQTSNLQVIARAGTGKTTTLVGIAERLPSTKILCIAFNKAIAQEMTERLPDNCEAKTMHSIGFAAWREFILPHCAIDDKKIYKLMVAFSDNLEGEDQEELREVFAETMQFCKTAKANGYLPSTYKGHWRPLVSDEIFWSSLPVKPSNLQIQAVEWVLVQSWKRALKGEIDFDDMVYCPALCQVSWPTFPLVLVDEAQDLSPLNHYVLKKIVKRNRLIAVGDPLQAIYGFRGADVKSMDNLSEMFKMDKLYLTTTFRCAKAIVRNAQWRAPDLNCPDDKEEGEVLRPQVISIKDIQHGDAVICRNNAPLFQLGILMIEHDLLPRIKGRDLAAPLKKIMTKLGKRSLSTTAAKLALEDWKQKELRRARDGAERAIHDKASCISIMLDKTENLGDAIHYLEHLLNRDGRVDLMTGHKAKGLEFNTVWFLEAGLCNLKHEQDKNIKYVVETRAMKKLVYLNFPAIEEWQEKGE